ncbi:MAG: hypothetical protein KA764_00455 [Anaerolineales bacterium]|nr:hypothetical protein [Anaerolineales bacterium]
MSLDFAGTLLGFLLTLAVLSYVIGDNPVYRAALHVFVGVTAGYAVIVALVNVVYPQLFLALLGPLDFARVVVIGISWLLVALLLFKVFNSQSAIGRLPVAYLAGVGAAVAVGGAVTGTLFPQTTGAFVTLLPDASASGDLLSLLEQPVSALILLAGTLSVLLFFWSSGRTLPGGRVDRPLLLKPVARVGQVFIGLTLGVLYAGALAAGVAYLAERLGFMWEFIQPFVGG